MNTCGILQSWFFDTWLFLSLFPFFPFPVALSALLVDYYTQAAQIKGDLDGTVRVPLNHRVNTITPHNHGLSSPDAYQSTTVYGLRPFSIYNLSLYATNEVEFCEGPGPSCGNVTMATIRPTRPSSPAHVQVVTTSGGSATLHITPPWDRGGHDTLQYDVAYRALVTGGGGSVVNGVHGDWYYDHARDGSQANTDEWPFPPHHNVTTTLVNLLPSTVYEIKVRRRGVCLERSLFFFFPT